MFGSSPLIEAWKWVRSILTTPLAFVQARFDACHSIKIQTHIKPITKVVSLLFTTFYQLTYQFCFAIR
jgi:hypothetical protein